MEYRQLGSSGLRVPALSFGTGTFGGKGPLFSAWGQSDTAEARRLIEPAVLRRLIDTITPEKIARLRQHQELEADAHRRNDKRAVIRLSGEFHTLAAELAGNSALSRSMRELCMLTCLTIFLYDAPTATSCRNDEHGMIIEALAKRDRAKAEKLMLDHLDHIESSLKLDGHSGEADLEALPFEERRGLVLNEAGAGGPDRDTYEGYGYIAG
mgnify:CR=1 FL=1